MQLIKTIGLLAAMAPMIAATGSGPDKPLPGQIICPTKPSSPQPAAQRQPYLKISMLIHKLDNITSDYFDQYWDKCDIPLALDCPAFTDNVVKFSAIHNTPALRAEMGDLGYPMLDYDGIIEFWVKDIDHWKAVTSSDCWQVVRKDAQSFTSWPYAFMYGYESLALDQTNRRGPGPRLELL